MNVVTWVGDSRVPYLTPEEVDTFIRFALQVHDHHATTPAQPIFWYRTDASGRFAN